MQRRNFLRVAGATAMVAAGNGAWYTFDGGHLPPADDAYSAWSRWSEDGEPAPLKLVRSAILASSPHNTQPWRFRVGDGFVELYVEASRSVAGLDPYLREAHIGMGCALENAVLAAAANGYSASVKLAEGALDGESGGAPLRLVARVELTPGLRQQSLLYNTIPHRHTNRSLYDRTQELPKGFANELLQMCSGDDVRMFLFTEDAEQRELARISASANLELYSDANVENGSEQWIRWRSADVKQHKDGLTIDTFGLPPFTTAMAKMMPTWMLKRASAPSRRSALYEQQMQSARLIGIIAVRDRLEKKNCLEAGRTWQRAHLFANARGVGARPCNEAIEMIDHERALGRPAKRLAELTSVTRDVSWQPTFLFLMGQPTLPAHASPRRPAESVEMA